MMSVEKLVKQLRGVDHMSVEDCFLQSSLFGHAADKLEKLAAALAKKDKEIAELREAVEPFSRLASVLCVGDADDAIVIGVSAGDLRRLVNVRRALEGGEANG